MVLTVLNVAEKPSVAKEVSLILSNRNARSRRGWCVCVACCMCCALRCARFLQGSTHAFMLILGSMHAA
jgi:hypothetical protein